MNAKHKIFVATLDIIRNQGMRAVRHRAVAEQAGVSLGSTTYHFKSIEDLIASTFLYWLNNDETKRKPHLMSMEENLLGQLKNDQKGSKLEELVFTSADNYLRSQIFESRDDRFVELAFHNEALRNTKLSELLLNAWQKDVEQIKAFYTLFGSKYPELDAENTTALLLQLERKSLLFSEEQLEHEYQGMRLVLKRHLEKMLAF